MTIGIRADCRIATLRASGTGRLSTPLGHYRWGPMRLFADVAIAKQKTGPIETALMGEQGKQEADTEILPAFLLSLFNLL